MAFEFPKALEPVGNVDHSETDTISLTSEEGHRFINEIDVGPFLYQVVNTDVDVSFQVNSIVGSGENSSAMSEMGLMMRNNSEADTLSAYVGLNANGSARLATRDTVGDGPHLSAPFAGAILPFWIRLARSGDTFSGYVSSDGVTWELVGAADVPMNSTYLVGIVQSNGTPGNEATGVGDNFQVAVEFCE